MERGILKNIGCLMSLQNLYEFLDSLKASGNCENTSKQKQVVKQERTRTNPDQVPIHKPTAATIKQHEQKYMAWKKYEEQKLARKLTLYERVIHILKS